jgi:hypothetical protein
LSAALTELQTQLTSLNARLAIATTPPALPSLGSLTASVGLALAAYNPINTLASLATLAPTLTADAAALTVKVNAVSSLVSSLTTSLAATGVTAIAYTGDAAQLGSSVQSVLGLSGSVNALVLATTSAPAWAALSATITTS